MKFILLKCYLVVDIICHITVYGRVGLGRKTNVTGHLLNVT